MALWGGRFSSDTNRNVAEFTESISYDKRLYAWDIVGSKAHVTMLAAAGIIPSATSKKICKELDLIRKKIEKGEMAFKTELEDIHMHIESELIKNLGDEGARVHTGRSRNDQVALDIRLYLRDEIGNLLEKLEVFQAALVKTADMNRRVIMPGFTHLQHAQPVLFAHHLLAYVEMFERDAGRLSDCLKRLYVLPLGSGAIAGSTLPLKREIVKELLDFPEMSRNSMDAVADRDFACELLSALSIFSMHVSRLSEDIIIWCSQEFAFVELSDAFTTGSSLMPQKKNPDIAELSRGKTGRVFGNLMALLTICKGLPLTYNRDLQEDKEPIFDSLDTANKILDVYPEMILTMKVNVQAMRKAASDPALMATDLAERLVKLGVPFRHAHHKVGSLVKYCRDNSKALNKLSLDEMRKVIPEADEECLSLFTPAKSVAARNIFGGTGPKEVGRQLRFWKNRLSYILKDLKSV